MIRLAWREGVTGPISATDWEPDTQESRTRIEAWVREFNKLPGVLIHWLETKEN